MAALTSAGGATAGPGDTYVHFYATTPKWKPWKTGRILQKWNNGFSAGGHAFVCVSRHFSSGPKEDCYGFNPKASPVGGQGALYNETMEIRQETNGIKNRFEPDYIMNPVSAKVDDAQLRALYGKIDDWNKKNYHFTNNNCIDFMQDAAQTIGLKTPGRNHDGHSTITGPLNKALGVVGIDPVTIDPRVPDTTQLFPAQYMEELRKAQEPTAAPQGGESPSTGMTSPVTATQVAANYDPTSTITAREPGGISLNRAAAEQMSLNLDLDSAYVDQGRLILAGKASGAMKVDAPLFLTSMRLACEGSDPYFSLDPDDGQRWLDDGRKASDELWKHVSADLKLDVSDWAGNVPKGLRFRSVSARRDYARQWDTIARKYQNLKTRLVFKPSWLAQTRFGEIFYKGDVLLKELSSGVPTVDPKDKTLRALKVGNYASAKVRSAGESLLANVDNGNRVDQGFAGNRFWFDLVPRAKSRMRSMLDDDPVVIAPYVPQTALGNSLKAELVRQGIEARRPQDPLRQVSLDGGSIDLSKIYPTMFVIGHDNASGKDVNGDDPFELAVADDVNRRMEDYVTAYPELRDLTQAFRLYVAAVALAKRGAGETCQALKSIPLMPSEKSSSPLPDYHPSEMFFTVASYRTTKAGGGTSSWWSSSSSHSGGVSPSGLNLYDEARKEPTPITTATGAETRDRREGSSWIGGSGRQYFAFILPSAAGGQIPVAAPTPTVTVPVAPEVATPQAQGGGMLDDIDPNAKGVIKLNNN